MIIKSMSTSKNISIKTERDTLCLVEICTFLGTTVFRDYIKPKDNKIKIKGLNTGKYIIHVSNDSKQISKQIKIH